MAISLLVFAAHAAAAPFQNGSFESGTTGWTFTAGPGAVGVSSGQGKSQGSFATAWNGGNSGPGAMISQTFDTVAGQSYNLQFDFGGFGTPLRTLSLAVGVNGTATLLSEPVSALSAGSSNVTTWDRFNFRFTADGASTTLTFTDTTSVANSSSADGNLDSISITPVGANTISPGGTGAIGQVNFQGGNVALASNGSVATQTNTRVGSGCNAPGCAIDGITNGNFTGGNSTTHTSNAVAGNQWQVNLGGGGEEFAIDHVTIFNRSDCCQDRLVEFNVDLLNTATGATDLNAFDFGNPSAGNVNTVGVSDNGANANQSHGQQGLQVNFAPNTIGTDVRVVQNFNAVLSLAEVQAIGLSNFNMGAEEILQIEIASNGSDFVNVEGVAVLNGTLSPSLLGGFEPQLFDVFDILTAATIDASGLTLNDTTGRLGQFQIVAGGNGQILQLVATPEPGSALIWSLLALGLAGVVSRRRLRKAG